MDSKRIRNLKRTRSLIDKVTEKNKKAVLNEIFGVSPISFDTPKFRKRAKAVFRPSDPKILNLYTLNQMRLFRRNNNLKVAICCMPKSGSTFILTSLKRVDDLDFQVSYIHTPYNNPSFVHAEQKENELDELALLKLEMADKNIISHLHMKSSTYSDFHLARNGYKVIVVRRNIFDCIVSMDDMICSKQISGFAMCRLPENYRALPESVRLNLLCRAAGPWYIDFIVSWHRTQLNTLVLDYETDVLNFSRDTANKIQNFLGFHEVDPNSFQKAFDIKGEARQNRARFNVGIVGRGSKIPKEARQSLLEIANAYKSEIDLSRFLACSSKGVHQ